MRKKNIIIYTTIVFTLLLSPTYYKGQDNSIAASVLAPASPQTGVPDISFPLVSLPAAKDFNLNFSLIYNPNSYRLGEYSGQVARNWMIGGSNFTITRKIIDSYSDEAEFSTNHPCNDIYYYNINGEQGSFKFEKIGSLATGLTFKIIKLTPSNLNIEFERESTPSKPVKYFTITDSKGYKYFFQDYDHINAGDIGYDLRNTFYITKIENQSGNEVVAYTNKKYIEYVYPDYHWTYLPEIISTKYGTIYIGHGDSGTSFDFQDRYYFQEFTLKDPKENFISKYVLGIGNGSYIFYDENTLTARTIITRQLVNMEKRTLNESIVDKIRFGYTENYVRRYGAKPDTGWGLPNMDSNHIHKLDDPNTSVSSILNSVILSNGGKIEYEFGANKLKAFNIYETNYYIDKNSSAYIQKMQNPFNYSDPEIEYIEQTQLINFDSNMSRIYHITGLQHSPNSRIYIGFQKTEIYPWSNHDHDPETINPEIPPKLSYIVKNTIKDTNSNQYWLDQEIEDNPVSNYYIVPSSGDAYIEITGSGGKGYFFIYEKFNINPPYINEITLPNSGVRIEKIKYYDKASNFTPNFPQYELRKTLTFDYSRFNEVGISSGIAAADDQKEVIIYKNIKITESDKPGYTKYYYKTLEDFPTFPHPTIQNEVVTPNFNIIKKGLLDKKEIYTSANNKKQSDILDYILPAIDTSKLYTYEVLCEHCQYRGLNPFNIYTQESFSEKVTTENYTYDSSGNSMKTVSEKTFNEENNNLMSEKTTFADGNITETEYKYAAEKGNTKLLGASMFSVPLEVTQKQNGQPTGKIETFYAHTDNYYPSSVKSSGINGAVINEEKNDIYDTMGNVLQSTSKTGIPTTYIYGYNSTILIAKIEGLKYSEVMAAFGLSSSADAYKNLEIYTKSNQDVSDATEEILRQKLDDFRLKPAFKNYQVTTYTYDPLIGVKSVTSPSGNKEYYFYDNANRLIRVEDINHNIIKDYQYKSSL